MSARDLLGIEPLELKFPFELKKQISCSLQLSNKTDEHIAFKVKTTSPKKYCVRPNTGMVLPRQTCDVIVTMQAQREAPPDMQCKDKFLVQSVVVTPGVTVKDITPEMFSKESGNVVEEVKLRVVYVPPPQPPSPVPEESEEGSSPRPSISDNANVTAREFISAASREQIEPQEKSSEAMALISRLTEEKNVAIQQNNKIQQELVFYGGLSNRAGAYEARNQQTAWRFLLHVRGYCCRAGNTSRLSCEDMISLGACVLLAIPNRKGNRNEKIQNIQG